MANEVAGIPADTAQATLRLSLPEDTDFLHRVYASTRADELAQTPWTAEQKWQFCLHQFQAQDSHYRTHYPTAEYFVIERSGVSIGRLIIDRTSKEIRLMDIALLPEYRGGGIGTRFLKDLQEEARTGNKVLGIYVEVFNPARRLYDRLGFQKKEEVGVYHYMEWRAAEAALQS